MALSAWSLIQSAWIKPISLLSFCKAAFLVCLSTINGGSTSVHVCEHASLNTDEKDFAKKTEGGTSSSFMAGVLQREDEEEEQPFILSYVHGGGVGGSTLLVFVQLCLRLPFSVRVWNELVFLSWRTPAVMGALIRPDRKTEE